MDAVSYSLASKQAQRIEKFIENPDSNSGVLTQPKVIEAGETVTIKSGRQAILADTVVDGDLVIEAGGDVFVPAGAGFGDLEEQIALKAPLESPTLTGNPTLNGEALVKLSSDGLRIEKSDNTSIKNQCTAWVNSDGTTTPPTIRDGYNVSSVIRTTTGVYELYFDNEMENLNYVVNTNHAIIGAGIIPTVYVKYLNKLVISTYASNSALMDANAIDVQIFGGKN